MQIANTGSQSDRSFPENNSLTHTHVHCVYCKKAHQQHYTEIYVLILCCQCVRSKPMCDFMMCVCTWISLLSRTEECDFDQNNMAIIYNIHECNLFLKYAYLLIHTDKVCVKQNSNSLMRD